MQYALIFYDFQLILARMGGRPLPEDNLLTCACMDQRGHDVPVATQTRLSFDVILPLWGHRGPR